jgi:sarcosine oxidase delta subunit
MFILNPYIFGTPITDSDVLAFITAATITDTTQKSAINQLVLDLKSANIWTKMKAIYPFVGGSASQHKWNLKDPRDLNDAFRLQFYGGGTHSSNGYQPDGATAYADTFLKPSLALSQNSSHVSYYSRTNNASDTLDFGTTAVGGLHFLSASIRQSNNYTYFRINRSYTTAESFTPITDSRLFYMINRTSSSEEILFTNTTKTTFSKNSTGLSNSPLYIGAFNDAGTARYFGQKECAFLTVGDGLNDTEATNLYNYIQLFNTTLGRQV